jgi:hypothetical protein
MPASVAFDLDPAFDSDLHPNSLSFRCASAARQEESAVSESATNRAGAEGPHPNTEAKPRWADGAAPAECAGP